MSNKKLKDSIIKDYISIAGANRYFEICRGQDLSMREQMKLDSLLGYSEKLLHAYKEIMFKLGLMDLSLAVLEKEMFFDCRECSIEKSQAISKVRDFSKKLLSIGKALPSKLASLSFNKFELSYLKVDSLSNFAF